MLALVLVLLLLLLLVLDVLLFYVMYILAIQLLGPPYPLAVAAMHSWYGNRSHPEHLL